jgi:hypothetical protein
MHSTKIERIESVARRSFAPHMIDPIASDINSVPAFGIGRFIFKPALSTGSSSQWAKD